MTQARKSAAAPHSSTQHPVYYWLNTIKHPIKQFQIDFEKFYRTDMVVIFFIIILCIIIFQYVQELVITIPRLFIRGIIK